MYVRKCIIVLKLMCYIVVMVRDMRYGRGTLVVGYKYKTRKMRVTCVQQFKYMYCSQL